MPTKVVHCKKAPYDTYVGRPSKWGNQFAAKDSKFDTVKCATTAEAVSRHEAWIRSRPDIMEEVKAELRGKVLGCWCDEGQPCHGRTLAQIADED